MFFNSARPTFNIDFNLIRKEMKNAAQFIRDLNFWMDSRNEHLNQDKTVKQLINEFITENSIDPNHYGEDGNVDFLGY